MWCFRGTGRAERANIRGAHMHSAGLQKLWGCLATSSDDLYRQQADNVSVSVSNMYDLRSAVFYTDRHFTGTQS